MKPQKINFATQVFPKGGLAFDTLSFQNQFADTTEFVLELANQVQSISVCYGYRFFGDTIRPSPNIIAFTQEIVVRKCENIEIVDICSSRNHTVADTETLIKVIFPNQFDGRFVYFYLFHRFFINIRRRCYPCRTTKIVPNRQMTKLDPTNFPPM